jgi:hypothetical protein
MLNKEINKNKEPQNDMSMRPSIIKNNVNEKKFSLIEPSNKSRSKSKLIRENIEAKVKLPVVMKIKK